MLEQKGTIRGLGSCAHGLRVNKLIASRFPAVSCSVLLRSRPALGTPKGWFVGTGSAVLGTQGVPYQGWVTDARRRGWLG